SIRWLPTTSKIHLKGKIQNNAQSLVTSTKQKSLTINRILSFWLLHQAIPWTWFFKQKWANLWVCHITLNCLKLCNSLQFQNKFNLIHDVWKIKGNRFGFIGESVSFIDNYWNYVFQHLSFKLVAWNQKKASLLKEAIVNVLEKHGLQIKIIIN
ncbi:hypothetical protein VP01_11605g1, partial [Puccinia sorghi]